MAQVDTASYPLPPPPNPATFYDNSTPPPNSELSQQLPYYQQKVYADAQPLIDSTIFDEPEIQPTVGFSDETNKSTKLPSDYLADEPMSYSNCDSSTTRNINLRYQLFLDKISPHWKARWTFSLITLVVFLARVIISQGWYVICYGLAIYYLNLLIGFISPRADPSLSLGEDDDDLGPMLPTSANDEFKPFIRRVPEFKFWISGTNATLIALVMTMFSIFDIPVFWPILLIYFIILVACTMRQQIKHMIRYSYVPWDTGKKKYAGGSNEKSSPTTV